VRQLCENKDTMTLKAICTSLATNVKLLDVMMQFVPPIAFLQPLCQLLDEWQYEEDQGW
jgi:mediator of RNA polymerase II transcription subunit 5